MVKFQKWLDQGMTPAQIMQRWNQGGGEQCRKGVNSKGVKYDSCEYVQVTMNYYNNI